MSFRVCASVFGFDQLMLHASFESVAAAAHPDKVHVDDDDDVDVDGDGGQQIGRTTTSKSACNPAQALSSVRHSASVFRLALLHAHDADL